MGKRETNQAKSPTKKTTNPSGTDNIEPQRAVAPAQVPLLKGFSQPIEEKPQRTSGNRAIASPEYMATLDTRLVLGFPMMMKLYF
jgi:hypothetical protein